MTLLSKFRGLSSFPVRNALLSPASQYSRRVVPRRTFRWDAKPDNVFGHSFRQGLLGPVNPIFCAIMGISVSLMFNWDELEKKYGIKIPIPIFQENMAKAKRDEEHNLTASDEVPSSLASLVYDRYGEKGVDAMVGAWEQQKDKSQGPDINAIHALMMAQASARYEEDVEAEAEMVGIDVEEAKQMLKKGGVGKFSVSAEEASSGVQRLERDLALENVSQEDAASKKVGFKDRRIMEYENRIRQYSTPDKVFRYFSTVKLVDEKGNSEVMMTPQDFLRSISPGEKQPDNLGLDSFKQVHVNDVASIATRLDLDIESVFRQLGSGGLISFSDYIFLLTVLSTSRRHFEIAFKMFDLNGDGTVDAEEFEKVTALMKSHSSTGLRHRDHGNTGNTFKGVNSGLKTFFFGEDMRGDLTVSRFLEFQRSLQEEILALEFARKDSSGDGRISEKDFADLLIAYAGFQPKKKAKMLRRVRQAYSRDEGEEESAGVTLTDYLNFYQVLYSINDIDTALTFYHIAGAPIERHTMKHVASTVAHVQLSDHLVDVVFTLFDTDGDGKLSNKEFVSVMKQRALRGLEKPKDMGISRIFSSLLKCAGDCKPAIIGGIKRTE